jgi:hypothetical protein
MMQQMQPQQVNRNIAMGAGLVIGLVLGLFIGWVLWPVEWQGALPNELFPDAKANYLSAVADAYVMYGTKNAADVARQRVGSFGDTLGGEIEAAIAYYSASNQEDKGIRISNLTTLASALGVPLPNLVGLTQNEQPLTQPTAAAESPATEEPVVGMSWLSWLIYLFLAVMVILLGIYLLLRLVRQRQAAAADGDIGQHIDREIGSASETTYDDWSQPEPGDDEPERDRPAREIGYSAGRTSTWRPAVVGGADDPDGYSFDAEPEEPSSPHTTGRNPTPGRSGPYTQFRLDPNRDALTNVEEGEEEEDDLLEVDEDTPNEPAVRPSAIRYGRVERTPEAPTLLPASSESATPPPAAPFRPEAARSAAYAGAAKSSKYKMLEIYTAHYQVGLHEYDESHPITDSYTGKYIGECGMGASPKNGLLQNTPDQVIALEIWLFDKIDERSMATQTRVLFSEYAIDHHLDQAFLKERQDDPRPIVAQPNVHFQLESQSLMLDCTIVEAIYTPSGPMKGAFQSVKVEMAVHKKG